MLMKPLMIIFLLLMSYTVNSQTYYAKSKTYIYQNMDNESAITGEIPKGGKVYVIDSFFGSFNGFWKIRYHKKTGYVNKNQLSYEKVSSTPAANKSSSPSTDQYKMANQDVGFEPFLAETTTSVNFRRAPSSNSNKIKTLPAATTLYVYSNKSINNYYKAIDIMTSQIGWVHKNYVRYLQDVAVNEDGAFQTTGYTSSYNSEVSIRNKSGYTIKLIVGEEIFTLNSNSTKIAKVTPGKKYYIATSPGVVPASGYQSFQSNTGYEWEFWVE